MLGLPPSVNANIILAKGHGLILNDMRTLYIPTFYTDSIEGVALAPRFPMNCAGNVDQKTKAAGQAWSGNLQPSFMMQNFISRIISFSAFLQKNLYVLKTSRYGQKRETIIKTGLMTLQGEEYSKSPRVRSSVFSDQADSVSHNLCTIVSYRKYDKNLLIIACSFLYVRFLFVETCGIRN